MLTNLQPHHWVQRYADDLFRYAMFRIDATDVCEDIVQDTFLSALKAQDQFQERSSEKTWLFSILKHKISDYYRKKGKFQTKELEMDDSGLSDFFYEEGRSGHWKKESEPQRWQELPNDHFEEKEYQAVLKACLARLSPSQAELVREKYHEEKKSADICKDMNLSASNYWVMLHRIHLLLRKCLEQHWFALS